MPSKTKLEEEFNLPPMDEMEEGTPEDSGPELPAEFASPEEEQQAIAQAMNMSDKINDALAEVRGMESHDGEMDDIATKALDGFDQLMDLGHNLTDMASGQVFTSATQMLKVALDARDSKVNRKLKQLDLMLKKEALDHRKEAAAAKAKGGDDDDGFVQAQQLDRNELMRIMREQSQDDTQE